MGYKKRKYEKHKALPGDYSYKDKQNYELKKVNEMRKALGMPLMKFVIRECLKCDTEFDTIGNNQHLCDKCRGVDDDNFEY